MKNIFKSLIISAGLISILAFGVQKSEAQYYNSYDASAYNDYSPMYGYTYQLVSYPQIVGYVSPQYDYSLRVKNTVIDVYEVGTSWYGGNEEMRYVGSVTSDQWGNFYFNLGNYGYNANTLCNGNRQFVLRAHYENYYLTSDYYASFSGYGSTVMAPLILDMTNSNYYGPYSNYYNSYNYNYTPAYYSGYNYGYNYPASSLYLSSGDSWLSYVNYSNPYTNYVNSLVPYYDYGYNASYTDPSYSTTSDSHTPDYTTPYYSSDSSLYGVNTYTPSTSYDTPSYSTNAADYSGNLGDYGSTPGYYSGDSTSNGGYYSGDSNNGGYYSGDSSNSGGYYSGDSTGGYYSGDSTNGYYSGDSSSNGGYYSGDSSNTGGYYSGDSTGGYYSGDSTNSGGYYSN